MNISINQLPDSMFLGAYQSNEVCQARILGRLEKKSFPAGHPDIEVVTPSGEKKYLTRNQINSAEFVGTNGNKVNVMTWGNDVKHIITHSLQRNVGIVHIPKNTKYRIVGTSGKLIRPGSYIICNKASDGSIIKDSYVVCSKKMFNIMFQIKENPKNAGKRVSAERRKEELRASGALSATIKNSKDNIVTIDKELDLAKFRVIGKVLDSSSGKMVGYVVTDGKTSANLDMKTVASLCEKKQIRNLTLVKNESGKMYFRCIGMTQESLNVTYI